MVPYFSWLTLIFGSLVSLAHFSEWFSAGCGSLLSMVPCLRWFAFPPSSLFSSAHYTVWFPLLSSSLLSVVLLSLWLTRDPQGEELNLGELSSPTVPYFLIYNSLTFVVPFLSWLTTLCGSLFAMARRFRTILGRSEIKGLTQAFPMSSTALSSATCLSFSIRFMIWGMKSRRASFFS